MLVKLQKFGTTLTSRQAGKESYAIFTHQLENLKENELLEIDFEGINTFSPSWGDEFLSPLIDQLGNNLILLNSQKNPSVKETINTLEEVNKVKFTIKS